MRMLLLGAKGQLGQELNRTLAAVGKVTACGRTEVDLTDEQSIIKVIDASRPDIMINAAAYTAVDKAESERELAFKTNAKAVAILAGEATKRDIWLIHYSTDYVFDGTKTERYLETDTPNPINVYGESKLAGEQAISESRCKHLIFRTTWVIGKDGNNFARTILRLAIERDRLGVINDQHGVPTSPALISKVTADAIKTLSSDQYWPSGIYHLAPQGETSWFGVAQALLQLAGEAQLKLATNASSLKAITTGEYPTVAKRPANSRLNINKLNQQLSFNLPHWELDFFATTKEIIEEFQVV